MTLYGLADCNNFFVSCERMFNPSLCGKPVVVLSNNDGCVISRSNEAKAMGIPMGCPAFQIKDHCDASKVIQLSARHILYSDLSHRVMAILGSEMENLEVYSVDEAFFTLPYDDVERNHEVLAALVKKVYRYVGIPISIGFASTRTLAKIASHVAKKDHRISDGVYWLMRPEAVDIILSRTPVADVWGIGRRLSTALTQRGVTTASQFAQMPSALVRSLFSVTGERTQRELRGEDCVTISPVSESRSTIMQSRTFAHVIADRQQVQDAVATFAEMCAKRLRDDHSVASAVMVYIRGDHHREDLPFYANQCQVAIPTPTSSTMSIVHYALLAFNSIYRDGFSYRKAGVMVSNITRDTSIQLNLFDKMDYARQRKLMQAVDGVNKHYGRNMVQLVPSSEPGEWRPNKNHFEQPSQTLRIYSAML